MGRVRLPREAVAGGDKRNSNICRQAEGRRPRKAAGGERTPKVSGEAVSHFKCTTEAK